MTKSTNKILIDAAYPEQTRLAIVEGNHLENYDQEISNNKTLKGNIYLAKVTRVEPSLQACFVDYGRERHGFLSLTEIHPDYYRIPAADKKILMEDFYQEQTRERSRDDRGGYRGRRGGRRDDDQYFDDQQEHPQDGAQAEQGDGQHDRRDGRDGEERHADRPNGRRGRRESTAGYRAPRYESDVIETAAAPMEQMEEDNQLPQDRDDVPRNGADSDVPRDNPRDNPHDNPRDNPRDNANGDDAINDNGFENSDRDGLGDDANDQPRSDNNDNMDDDYQASDGNGNVDGDSDGEDYDDNDGGDMDRSKMSRLVKRRRYKIQEVIKKGQVILVQVVKDERGQKGAAMTSYLSLAGRYCVVMPNATKGGGISRKISMAERDHLRNVMRSLSVPQGMGLIIRTAGADRSEDEIKADYDYVLKLWDHIREVTVSSEAPLLIYEEGSLVKKAIRNYNNSNIDEIWIEGEEAFNVAMETMKAIAPEETDKLKKYLSRDHKNKSLFNFHNIEYEIQSIYEPFVPLHSGGMLVINQTEALVAIDVNSGKAIRERNIEETALRTNLEAAAEVARQLRLRDLSGQIVIDFIDMENNRNIYQVEKFFRDQLRQDRARVQVARIGMFGMLEMTRQRLRPSITETVMQECPHCHGTGKSFRPEYYSLQFLRELFNLVQEKGAGRVVAEVPTDLAKDLLSTKREKLNEIEEVYKVDLEFVDLPPKSLEPYIINYSKGKSTGKKPAGKTGRGKKSTPLDFISATGSDD